MDISDSTRPWLIPDPNRDLERTRLADGCAKLRADAVAARLEEHAQAEGIAELVEIKSGFTNKNPMVEILQKHGGHRVGWQLQGDSWRLAAVLSALDGRSPERRAARERWAEAHLSWFDFGLVQDAVPDWREARGSVGHWNRYDPDFVYRSLRVPSITVGTVLELGMAYAHRATAFSAS